MKPPQPCVIYGMPALAGRSSRGPCGAGLAFVIVEFSTIDDATRRICSTEPRPNVTKELERRR